MSFRWTPKRDQALRSARADGFSFHDAANMVGGGASEGDARTRMRELRALPATQGNVAVPRPAAPAPARSGLIDLSKAPSSMEQQASRWRG
jgi:hypothetical protein